MSAEVVIAPAVEGDDGDGAEAGGVFGGIGEEGVESGEEGGAAGGGAGVSGGAGFVTGDGGGDALVKNSREVALEEIDPVLTAGGVDAEIPIAGDVSGGVGKEAEGVHEDSVGDSGDPSRRNQLRGRDGNGGGSDLPKMGTVGRASASVLHLTGDEPGKWFWARIERKRPWRL